MILRRTLLILNVSLLLPLTDLSQTVLFPFRFMPLTSVVFAQDLNHTVVPITPLHLKLKAKPMFLSPAGSPTLIPGPGLGVETDFGTGFCLDPECRLIGTNYHVAMMARPQKIEGTKVIQRYLATGPDDDGATVNDVFSANPMKYNLRRDLAIFELRRPIPHYHGITYSLSDLEIGQQVDIYAYPKESINPKRSLLRFHGEFKGETAQGLLAFEYGSSSGKTIRGGASGGLVVDTKTQQVVGVLSRAGVGEHGKLAALAVPIQSLTDFVGKVQPWLAERIFPATEKEVISPTLGDLYPKLLWAHTASVQHRSDEPADVKLLRQKAQVLADSMRNFIAVQTFAWGSGQGDTPVAMADYEVRVVDGYQRFRQYPNGKQELQDVPFPSVNTVIVPGGEWSELPQMVGRELGLKIQQLDDMLVNDRLIKVFQYRAEVEDGVCNFKSVWDLVFYTINKAVNVPCYGEVWTDQDTNILRISEHLELSGKWRDWQGVVTYGWLRQAVDVPQLIPLTISTQAQFKNKVYWCRGQFTNYRIFISRTKIVAYDHAQSLPP